MPKQTRTDVPSGYIEQRLSAQVRARLLFQRELEIDAAGVAAEAKTLITDDLLKGLVEQRRAIEKQRNDLMRNLMLIVFAMYLSSNDAQITIPGLGGTNLWHIPGLSSFLSVLAAITLLMLAMASISAGAYVGLLHQVSIYRFESSGVDPDIHAAAMAPQWLVFKIFQNQFSYTFETHINPKGIGRAVYAVAYHLGAYVLLMLFGLIYVYVTYFLLAEVPNDYFGIAVKALAGLVLFYSVFLHLASTLEFTQRVHIGPPQDARNSDKSLQKNGG